MRRRVVITGMGCINPLGNDVETMWSGVKEGRSGVGYTTIFDASKFPHQDFGRGQELGHHPDRRRPRATGSIAAGTRKFACGAAKQAVAQSGILDAGLDPTRIGVYLGCGEGSQDFTAFSQMMTAALKPDGLDLATFATHGPGDPQPRRRDRAGAEHAGRLRGRACSTPRGRTPTA